MVFLILVDDDQSFIKTANHFSFDATLKTFINPADALIEITQNPPDIIVSDVMMPGINGMQFITVARAICPKAHIVVISANSKEDIERIHKIRVDEGITFFRKALGKEFFDHLDNTIEKIKSNPISEENTTVDVINRLDLLNKVSDHYLKYHNFIETMAYNGQFSSDLSWSKQEDLARNLKFALDLLFPIEEQESVLAQLAKKHKNWEGRILEHTKEFVKPEKLTCEEPFYVDLVLYQFKGRVDSFEIGFDNQENVFLKVNDFALGTSSFMDWYRSNAGAIVMFSDVFRSLKKVRAATVKKDITMFWRGLERVCSIGEFKIKFQHEKNIGYDEAKVINTSGAPQLILLFEGKVIKGIMPEHIPTTTLITRIRDNKELKIVHKSETIQAFISGNPLKWDIEQILADLNESGIETYDTARTRAEKSLEYIFSTFRDQCMI